MNVDKNKLNEITKPQQQQRPVSFYDNNLVDSRNRSSNNNASDSKEYTLFDSPTQTHCLNTTVPQNIASPLIGGKHAPTRNSLRHSRMIVLNRSGQAITPMDIPFIRYKIPIILLLVLVFTFGAILCFISLWLLLWSPNSRPRDNPYWSAIPILLSGFLGFVFVRCFPKDFPGRTLSYWVKSVKYFSISMSSLAALACIAVFFLALFHIILINNTVCMPAIPSDNTCLCKINDNNTTTSEDTIFSYNYHYLDFNCSEVKNVLRIVKIFICVANAIVLVMELIYLYTHWLSRNIFYYSRVPMYGKELTYSK